MYIRSDGKFIDEHVYIIIVIECIVSWDGSVSTPFSVSNDVCQGGVLSPVLFTVYMDILLNMLKDLDCGVGCYWDGVFVGALGYADDIILLAPCPSALRLMLHVNPLLLHMI